MPKIKPDIEPVQDLPQNWWNDPKALREAEFGPDPKPKIPPKPKITKVEPTNKPRGWGRG